MFRKEPDTGQTVTYDVSAVLHDFQTSKSHVQYVRTLNHGTMLIMDGEIQYSTLDEHRYHYLLTTLIFQQSRRILILGEATVWRREISTNPRP